MSSPQVRTCAESLLNPGICCETTCSHRASVATLNDDPDPGSVDLIEHTRCADHTGDALATKEFTFHPLWAPTGTS